MDRGAWLVAVHGVTESDRTEVTEHTHKTLLRNDVTLCKTHIKFMIWI